MKKFLITWGNTNVILSEKSIKENYTHDTIMSLLKDITCNLYVYTGILKCYQHINSVSLLVAGFGWYFTFLFVPFALFELEITIMSMRCFYKNNKVKVFYVYIHNLDIHKTHIRTDIHTYT